VASGPVLGVDPGTAKCGLAVVDAQGECLYRRTVALAELVQTLEEGALRALRPRVAALGDRTGTAAVRVLLVQALPEVPVRTVPEHRTTELARKLYWEYHPPRGWRRLMPRGLLVPPEPLDGYAAELLARSLRDEAEGAG